MCGGSSLVGSGALRVGVIGIGFGQAAHVPAFRSAPRCVVRGIAASELPRARRVAERLGIPEAFGDWRDLLTSDIDAVTVALPPDLQPEVVVAAAGRGLHVFCEKPLAADLPGAKLAHGAVTAAGVVNAIDFEFPELPEWAEALSLVGRGTIGPVEDVRITWHTRTGLRRSLRASWKSSDGRGGGATGGLLAHAIHHARRFLSADRLQVRSCHVRRVRDEMKEIGLVASGPQGGVTISVKVDHDGQPLHLIEVLGRDGRLTLASSSLAHGGPFSLTVGGRAIAPEGGAGEDRRALAVAHLARRFAEAVRSRAQMRPSLEDGLRVQEVIDAVASAR